MIPHAKEWHIPYEVKNDKIFGSLTVLSYLLEKVAPATSWRERLLDLVESLSVRNQVRMGFTEGWKDCPIWSKWLSDSEGTADR